jgi:hypothetical protein
MRQRGSRVWIPVLWSVLAATLSLGAAPKDVAGSFVMNGVDARLAYARAKAVELEKGNPGYLVLLSSRSAKGDIGAWRTGEPAERGSFIFLMLEKSGGVWVAEIGHAAAKSGRFGVVTELQVSDFSSAGDRLRGRVRTKTEQTFSDDRYKIDLSFDASLEQ